MKIAILTLPLHTNYGGILQAYALQQILSKNEHEVTILHHTWREQKEDLLKKTKRIIRRFGKFLLKDSLIIINENRYIKRNHNLFFGKIESFVKNYINLLYLDNLQNFEYQNFDAIIVGSDQVWRPQYFTKMWESPIENAYLHFIYSSTVKKIAYACSLGVDQWEYSVDETELCKEAVSKFKLISCREISGVKLINKYLDANASFVLDPTLLLDRSDYEVLCDTLNDKVGEYGLLSYLLDESDEKTDFVSKVADEKNLTIKNIRTRPALKRYKKNEDILISVEEWLNSFKNCRFVITDSFHACVFAIIFNKPFIVISNNRRGSSRFESLLGTLRLGKNLLSDISHYDSEENYSIPSETDEILSELKLKSKNILFKALNETD